MSKYFSDGTDYRDSTDLSFGLFDGMADALLLASYDDAELLYVNPAFLALFGVTSEELRTQSLLTARLQLTLCWPELLQGLRGADSGAAHWQGKLSHQRKDGSRFWTSVSAALVSCRDAPSRVLAVYRDITGEHEFQQAWRESESLRQRALRLATIGHWRLNPVTGALSGTDELYQIFELPPQAPLDDFDKTVHPEDRESLNQIMQTTLQNRGVYDSSYRLVTRNGNHKWVHAIGEGVFDDDDSLVEIVGSVQDITAFRRVEDELQKMQRLESLGVLAGGIAHDFNNILTALFGNLSLARSKLQPGHPAQDELLAAENAMQRASNLSNQLLTFAKGGEPLKTSLDLHALVRDITRFDLAGSAVRLRLESSESLWRLAADQSQLEQVIGNLIINARQAMPQGGVLRIALHNVQLTALEHPALEGGPYVRICVQDEGEGIAEQHLGHVFDPYFTTRPGGSGLGLATAYSIVKRHHGHIEVSSKQGAGATFTLYLPATPAAQPVPHAQGVVTRPAAYGKGRILVMDDEVEICSLVVRMLQQKGYRVDAVHDGAHAIAAYRSALDAGARYDCVLMDLTIPGGMGGKEAMLGLLALDPSVVALVSSGYGVDPIMANHVAYGFKGVVPKPYNLQMLTQAVEKVVAPTLNSP